MKSIDNYDSCIDPCREWPRYDTTPNPFPSGQKCWERKRLKSKNKVIDDFDSCIDGCREWPHNYINLKNPNQST